MIARTLLVAAALALSTQPSWAQEADAIPAHGSLTLAAGFSPAPQTVDFDAVGEAIDAGSLSTACAGLVGEAADVHLDYTAGNDVPLSISVVSSSQVTLLLRGPDGAWYCDAGSEGAPSLSFSSPQSGRYAIWVGSTQGAQAVEVQFSEDMGQ